MNRLDFSAHPGRYRRATVRPDEHDRRDLLPTFDGSPWVKAAKENRLPPGGAMATSRERETRGAQR